MGRAEDLFQRLENGREGAVDALVSEAKAEEHFLDFKQSSDGGAGVGLDGKDRTNLAKCLSGFANSDGGVVVWGIATSGKGSADAASGRQVLADCRRFASLIDAAVSGCTLPPVVGVRSIPIAVGGGPGGFVATLIPASERPPHQTFDSRVYSIRSGSNFPPAMHGIVADMFGRSARPRLEVEVKVQNDAGIPAISLLVSNTGRGVAQGSYVLLSPVERLAVPGHYYGSLKHSHDAYGKTLLAHDMNQLIHPGMLLRFENVLMGAPVGDVAAIPRQPFECRIGAVGVEESVSYWVLDFANAAAYPTGKLLTR